MLGLGQPAGHKLHEVLAIGAEHPQGAIPRIYQLTRRADDPSENIGQLKVGTDGHHSVKEGAKTFLGPGGCLRTPAKLVQQVLQVNRGRRGPRRYRLRCAVF
jgi:hypothetical protein